VDTFTRALEHEGWATTDSPGWGYAQAAGKRRVDGSSEVKTHTEGEWQADSFTTPHEAIEYLYFEPGVPAWEPGEWFSESNEPS